MIRAIVDHILSNLASVTFRFWEFYILPLVWLLTGTTQQIRRIQSGEEKIKRVQILDIWFRNPTWFTTKAAQFILSHSSFEDLNDIDWKKAFIYRVSITEQHVEFVLFDDTVEPFNVRKNPIFCMTQSDKASKLIRTPINDFIQLGRSFDVKDKRVVWMMHAARCGSTAWAQVFASLPEWTTLSEVQPFVEFLSCYDGEIEQFTTSVKFFDMVEAAFRMCLHQIDTPNVFIKATLFDQYIILAIRDRFPEHKFLYSYRNALPSAMSTYKAFNVPPVDYACQALAKDLNSGGELARSVKGVFTHNYRKSHQALEHGLIPQDLCEWHIMGWSAITSYLLKLQEQGLNIKGVKYERLMQNQRVYLESVFRHLGIDVVHVPLAQDALEPDSQVGTSISKQNRRINASWDRAERGVERANRIMKYFGFADVDMDYAFPNSL